MYAVIEINGKQYRVAKGDTIQIDDPKTDKLTPRVVMTGDKGSIVTDPEALKKVSVTATVNGTYNRRLDRVMRFRKKQGGSSKRMIGHRRPMASVTITGLSAGK